MDIGSNKKGKISKNKQEDWKQMDLLLAIYKRLGWVLFWVILFGLLILIGLPD